MHQNVSEDIAASVRAELGRAGKSGRQVAAELDWPYPQLWRRISGEVPFSGAELARIAAHLDIPVERLYAQQSTEQAS